MVVVMCAQISGLGREVILNPSHHLAAPHIKSILIFPEDDAQDEKLSSLVGLEGNLVYLPCSYVQEEMLEDERQDRHDDYA
mmetsp:Transcript_48178/g.71830  ORF Transcript_48178/g.71830 Transcript_48178/m.71830 type:complete len:81 (+) Transcript_48178:356-598(+)